MKIVSYNINGIRAAQKLGLLEWVERFNADVFCFQEVRCNEELTKEILSGCQNQINLFDSTCGLQGYNIVYNCGERAGYAGTLTLTKRNPDKVFYDMGEFWKDNEGRTTTIVVGDVAIINAYIPNGNSRLDFKMQYLEALNNYIQELQKKYKVICVGDYNIAHNEIDLTNPKECRNKSVFLPIEREAFGKLLDLNLIDSFRFLNPEKVEYSWRSYRSRIDPNHKGWKYRIDYILVDNKLKNELKTCDILDLEYSDHLAVVCELKN